MPAIFTPSSAHISKVSIESLEANLSLDSKKDFVTSLGKKFSCFSYFCEILSIFILL
tara:strand:+ start:523 stop:693 length:171 start_codon:yes stop_codon:yes gene_type:complete